MKWFVIINYEINKDFISANYCQNKNNASLHCEGKCYLLIELKKEEAKQKQFISFFKNNVELICEKVYSAFNFIP